MAPKLKTQQVCRLGAPLANAPLRAGLIVGDKAEYDPDFITPQYALVYIIKGEGEYHDRSGEIFELKPGTLFQRFPQRRHGMTLSANSIWAYIGLPSQVFELFSITGFVSEQQPVNHIGHNDEIIERFKEEISALKRCQQEKLVSGLNRLQQFATDLLLRAPRSSVGEHRFPLAKACKILGADLDCQLKMTDVAMECALSYSQFRQEFARLMGVSPGNYRIRRKIERAIELINEDKLAFKEIAQVLGYPSVYAFSAQFKRIALCTPGQYRKSIHPGQGA